MIIRQTIMVLNVFLENKELSIQELVVKIEEKYGVESYAVKTMFLDEIDKDSHLVSLLKDMYCIKVKNDLFYYDENSIPDNEFDSHQRYIYTYLLALKEKKLKETRNIEDYGENITRKR